MMNAQQAEEFVRLVAEMTTRGLMEAASEVIVTARKIAGPPAPAPEPTAQQLELMAVEWSAWRTIARLWKTHRPEMEAAGNNQLLLAIRMWGEELVALRMTQTPQAREEARVMYATERRT